MLSNFRHSLYFVSVWIFAFNFVSIHILHIYFNYNILSIFFTEEFLKFFVGIQLIYLFISNLLILFNNFHIFFIFILFFDSKYTENSFFISYLKYLHFNIWYHILLLNGYVIILLLGERTLGEGTDFYSFAFLSYFCLFFLYVYVFLFVDIFFDFSFLTI